jgi:hypothetical protein
MGNVTIKCFNNADDAFDEAERAKGAGRPVAIAGPTEIVKVKGSAPDEIRWDSGPDFDWYVVITSTDDNLVMP